MAKAWKIPHLNPDDNVKACLKRILATRFREMFSYEKGTLEGADIEALHDMRVSSRRLQSVLKIFADCFPRRKHKTQVARVRGLIRCLGRVRDYDVFIDMLEKSAAPLVPDERKILDLMIARQKNLRLQERKNLLCEFKRMEKEMFKEKFLKFVDTAL